MQKELNFIENVHKAEQPDTGADGWLNGICNAKQRILKCTLTIYFPKLIDKYYL